MYQSVGEAGKAGDSRPGVGKVFFIKGWIVNVFFISWAISFCCNYSTLLCSLKVAVDNM